MEQLEQFKKTVKVLMNNYPDGCGFLDGSKNHETHCFNKSVDLNDKDFKIPNLDSKVVIMFSLYTDDDLKFYPVRLCFCYNVGKNVYEPQVMRDYIVSFNDFENMLKTGNFKEEMLNFFKNRLLEEELGVELKNTNKKKVKV